MLMIILRMIQNCACVKEGKSYSLRVLVGPQN